MRITAPVMVAVKYKNRRSPADNSPDSASLEVFFCWFTMMRRPRPAKDGRSWPRRCGNR